MVEPKPISARLVAQSTIYARRADVSYLTPAEIERLCRFERRLITNRRRADVSASPATG